jgi:hypothetical protein
MLIAALSTLALVLPACGGGEADPPSASRSEAQAPSPSPPAATPTPWPTPERYVTDPAEGFPNGKRLAARVAATALTYPPGSSAREVARRLGPSAVTRRALASAIAPGIDPEMASSGKVIYPQLSGITPTSLGAMVVVRQRLRRVDGRSRAVTRVVDVRLRRDGGPWKLDRIGSVGGRAVPRPAGLSSAARRVLDNPRIALPDTARWDIYRGGIDEGLLETLDDLAGRRRISVSVLRAGHPREVWATSRPSAHSRGYAADIYAVGGRLVVAQPDPGSPAHAMTSSLVAAGAAQVGSPWVLAPGGSRSFSDDVHQDHVHLQWTGTS